MDIYSLTIFGLSTFAIFLVVWAFLTGRKLYQIHIIRILIIFFIVSFTCLAQENGSSSIVVGDRPFVPSGGIIDGTKILENEAKATVDYLFEDDLWRQSAYLFLYGNASLINKTNLTNLTA